MTAPATQGTRLLELPSRLTRARFVERYGDVYEHSAWIANAVWPQAASGELDTVEGLHAALRRVVDACDTAEKLELIRLHPDLAGKAAIAGDLSAPSKDEQAGAGLAQLSQDQFALIQSLNDRYKKKFGFPFVLAVRGLTTEDVLEAFERRLENDAETEFAAALEESHKIALLRLKALSVERD